MGRTNLPFPFLIAEEKPTSSSFLHSLISTFFFITLVFGSMFIISSLCGTLSRGKRKKQEQTFPDDNESKNNKDPSPPQQQSPENNVTSTTTPPDVDAESSQQQQQPLPPPPGRRQLGVAASYHVRSESSASSKAKTDLASSLSMRVMGEKMKNTIEKKKEKNLKHEDSIWKKTIILGDKCKVPDEDEDDPIIYDEKGNRISTYHKKNANSMALSRQSSAIDQDALNIAMKGQNQIDDLIKQEEILK